jgi:translation initiation factor 2 subunit 1
MKRGLPEKGELVVCRVTRIHPNSVEAELLEYEKSGMIHVSEVASRWVRDIREFLKENQYVVCRVVGVDQRGISLSVKRVRKEEGNRRLNEFKRERKAGNMLEQAAKSLKKSRKEAYQEVGFLLQEEFGSLAKAFEVAVKNPSLLKKKGVPPAWEKAIRELAQKKFSEKTYELKGEVEMFCYKPDGIEVIKRILLASQKRGFGVSYISAPRYAISSRGKDIKKLRMSMQEEGEAIVRAIEKAGGEGKFTLME